MSDIKEKLNNESQRAIWIAKSIASENRIKYLYPEALAIAIVGYGPNVVTRILAQLNVDADKIVGQLRECLAVHKREPHPVFQTKVIIPTETIQLIRVAVDCRNRMSSSMIGLHHIMLALFKLNERIRRVMESEGVTLTSFEGAVKNLIASKYQDGKSAESNTLDDRGGRVETGAGIKSGGRPLSSQPGLKKSRNTLETYCIDITAKAMAGELNAVVGREAETERVITTLCRKNKNNPLLVGEHGVGKTAVVEGLAQRIVSNNVPEAMKNRRVFALDMAGLVAGTTYRGQFEERVKSVLTAIKENPDAIIFIDEIHTMIGAGGAIGSLDASNMLKPALARGELRCIGATTEDEYKRYFKKDGALDRRFQRIRINEPSPSETIEMLNGLRPGFEKHHHCKISDEALKAAVGYSERYIAERHLPDKAIDVIDEVCARYASKLKDGQSISVEHVANVISDQAGIPMSVVMPSDCERLQEIDTHLHSVIIGQDRAIETLIQAVGNSYAGIRDPIRPMGCFMFAGPSGVGKTYTAKEFAKALFGSPDSYIQINMTEFNDRFQASRLLGSPPGYVGHGNRNQLADKVLQHPYCFVLFDEIDKADPEVLKILLPIMSEGRLVDSEGTEISFRNAFIGLTTNIGFGENDKVKSIGFGESSAVSREHEDRERVLEMCRKRFGPEFVNRLDEVVIFDNLSDEGLARILRLELNKLETQAIGGRFKLDTDDSFLSQFVQISKNHHGINGFRLKRAIQMDIQPVLTKAILKSKDRLLVNTVKLKIKGGKVVIKD